MRLGVWVARSLVTAGIERLLIEQIRINPVLNFAGLHATQAEFISVAMMVFGLAGLLLLARRTTLANQG